VLGRYSGGVRRQRKRRSLRDAQRLLSGHHRIFKYELVSQNSWLASSSLISDCKPGAAWSLTTIELLSCKQLAQIDCVVWRFRRCTLQYFAKVSIWRVPAGRAVSRVESGHAITLAVVARKRAGVANACRPLQH
jgi:hypothetical protein